MRSRRQPCGYTSRLTAQRGRDRGDRHVFGVRPLKTRCRGSTRGCKLRCRSPAGTGGASTQPHGDEGSDGAGGGHGHKGPGGQGNRGWERTQGTEGPPSGPPPPAPPPQPVLTGIFWAYSLPLGVSIPAVGHLRAGFPSSLSRAGKRFSCGGEETLKRALYPSFPPSQKPSRHPPARRREPWRGCGSCPSAGSPCRRGLPRRAGGSRCPPGRTRPAGPPHGPAATAAPAPRRDLRRAGGVEVPSGSRWVPSLPLFPVPVLTYLPAPPPWRGPYRCRSPCPAPLGAALPPVPYIGRVGCARRGRGAAGGLLPSHRAAPAAHRGLAPTAARPHGLPPALQHTGAVGNGGSRAPHG